MHDNLNNYLRSTLSYTNSLVFAWADWLGVIGVLLGFILTQGVVIFPIIYWIVEGDFPTLYFALMFAGWLRVWLKPGWLFYDPIAGAKNFFTQSGTGAPAHRPMEAKSCAVISSIARQDDQD